MKHYSLCLLQIQPKYMFAHYHLDFLYVVKKQNQTTNTLLFQLQMNPTFSNDLPRIQLKFRTIKSKNNQTKSNPFSIPQFIPTPPSYLEKMKMKKDLQESFWKVRQMKKNNYLRRYESQQRNVTLKDSKLRNRFHLNKQKSLVNFQTMLQNSDKQQQIIGDGDEKQIFLSQQKVPSKKENSKSRKAYRFRTEKSDVTSSDEKYLTKDNIELKGVKINSVSSQIRIRYFPSFSKLEQKIVKLQKSNSPNFEINAWNTPHKRQTDKQEFEAVLIK